MTTPAEHILEAFDAVSADARKIVGEALNLQSSTLLKALGSALMFGSSKLSVMSLDRALHMARWNGDVELLDRLGDDPPWCVVAEAIRSTIDGREEEVEIASDLP